jgi:hypothetical protein
MEIIIIYVVGAFVVFGIVTVLQPDKETSYGCVAGLIWPAMPFVILGSIVGLIIKKLFKVN